MCNCTRREVNHNTPWIHVGDGHQCLSGSGDMYLESLISMKELDGLPDEFVDVYV